MHDNQGAKMTAHRKNAMNNAFGRVITAICVLAAFVGCAGVKKAVWKDPDVAFAQARLVSFNLAEARMELDLAVTNNNSYTINYGALEYVVGTAQGRLFSGRKDDGGALKAGETSTLTLPVTVKFADLMKFANNFRPGADVEYTLDGSMVLNSPLGAIKLPLHDKGTMPTR
jgi:LEA14-like dessication related protein